MGNDYIRVALVLLVLGACAPSKAPRLTSIEGSPRVFEDAFNASPDAVRVVLLLSPT